MKGFKKYRYKGKIYYSGITEKAVENYGGNLFDLYVELKADGKAGVTIPLYYRKTPDSLYYGAPDELIEHEFSDLEVKE